MEVLERDVRMVTGSTMKIAMSVVTMTIQDLLQLPDCKEGLSTFTKAQNVDVVVIMSDSSSVGDNNDDSREAASQPSRQIAVYSADRIFREQIADRLDNASDIDLELEMLHPPFEDITIFQQGNVSATMSKVAPVLESFLNGDLTPDVSSKEFVTQTSVAMATEGFSSLHVMGGSMDQDKLIPISNHNVVFNLKSVEGESIESTELKPQSLRASFDSENLFDFGASPEKEILESPGSELDFFESRNDTVVRTMNVHTDASDTSTKRPSGPMKSSGATNFLSSANSSNLLDFAISDSELVDPFSSVEEYSQPSFIEAKESKVSQSDTNESKDENVQEISQSTQGNPFFDLESAFGTKENTNDNVNTVSHSEESDPFGETNFNPFQTVTSESQDSSDNLLCDFGGESAMLATANDPLDTVDGRPLDGQIMDIFGGDPKQEAGEISALNNPSSSNEQLFDFLSTSDNSAQNDKTIIENQSDGKPLEFMFGSENNAQSGESEKTERSTNDELLDFTATPVSGDLTNETNLTDNISSEQDLDFGNISRNDLDKVETNVENPVVDNQTVDLTTASESLEQKTDTELSETTSNELNLDFTSEADEAESEAVDQRPELNADQSEFMDEAAVEDSNIPTENNPFGIGEVVIAKNEGLQTKPPSSQVDLLGLDSLSVMSRNLSEKSVSLIVECDPLSQADNLADLADLDESDMFDKVATPEIYQSGENSPFVNSGIATPNEGLPVARLRISSETEYVPPNSLIDTPGFDSDRTDHGLPSFNSAEMVERIHKKKASLGQGLDIFEEEQTNAGNNLESADTSVPFTPQNSFRDDMESYMLDRSLPTLNNSNIFDKVQMKRNSLGAGLGLSVEGLDPQMEKQDSEGAKNPFGDFGVQNIGDENESASNLNPFLQVEDEKESDRMDSLDHVPFTPMNTFVDSTPVNFMKNRNSLTDPELMDKLNELKLEKDSENMSLGTNPFEFMSNTYNNAGIQSGQTGSQDVYDIFGAGSMENKNQSDNMTTMASNSQNPFADFVDTENTDMEQKQRSDTFGEENLIFQMEQTAQEDAAESVADHTTREIINVAMETFPDLTNQTVANQVAMQIMPTVASDWMTQGSGDSGIGSSDSPQMGQGVTVPRRLVQDYSVETEYLPSMDPLHGSLNMIQSPSSSQSIETDADKEVVEGESFRKVSGTHLLEQSIHQGQETSTVLKPPLPDQIRDMIIKENIETTIKDVDPSGKMSQTVQTAINQSENQSESTDTIISDEPVKVIDDNNDDESSTETEDVSDTEKTQVMFRVETDPQTAMSEQRSENDIEETDEDKDSTTTEISLENQMSSNGTVGLEVNVAASEEVKSLEEIDGKHETLASISEDLIDRQPEQDLIFQPQTAQAPAPVEASTSKGQTDLELPQDMTFDAQTSQIPELIQPTTSKAPTDIETLQNMTFEPSMSQIPDAMQATAKAPIDMDTLQDMTFEPQMSQIPEATQATTSAGRTDFQALQDMSFEPQMSQTTEEMMVENARVQLDMRDICIEKDSESMIEDDDDDSFDDDDLNAEVVGRVETSEMSDVSMETDKSGLIGEAKHTADSHTPFETKDSGLIDVGDTLVQSTEKVDDNKEETKQPSNIFDSFGEVSEISVGIDTETLVEPHSDREIAKTDISGTGEDESRNGTETDVKDATYIVPDLANVPDIKNSTRMKLGDLKNPIKDQSVIADYNSISPDSSSSYASTTDSDSELITVKEMGGLMEHSPNMDQHSQSDILDIFDTQKGNTSNVLNDTLDANQNNQRGNTELDIFGLTGISGEDDKTDQKPENDGDDNLETKPDVGDQDLNDLLNLSTNEQVDSVTETKADNWDSLLGLSDMKSDETTMPPSTNEENKKTDMLFNFDGETKETFKDDNNKNDFETLGFVTNVSEQSLVKPETDTIDLLSMGAESNDRDKVSSTSHDVDLSGQSANFIGYQETDDSFIGINLADNEQASSRENENQPQLIESLMTESVMTADTVSPVEMPKDDHASGFYEINPERKTSSTEKMDNLVDSSSTYDTNLTDSAYDTNLGENVTGFYEVNPEHSSSMDSEKKPNDVQLKEEAVAVEMVDQEMVPKLKSDDTESSDRAQEDDVVSQQSEQRFNENDLVTEQQGTPEIHIQMASSTESSSSSIAAPEQESVKADAETKTFDSTENGNELDENKENIPESTKTVNMSTSDSLSESMSNSSATINSTDSETNAGIYEFGVDEQTHGIIDKDKEKSGIEIAVENSFEQSIDGRFSEPSSSDGKFNVHEIDGNKGESSVANENLIDQAPAITVDMSESTDTVDSRDSEVTGFYDINAEIQGTVLQNIEIGNAFSPIQSPSEEVFAMDYEINPLVSDTDLTRTHIEPEASTSVTFSERASFTGVGVEELADSLVQEAFTDALHVFETGKGQVIDDHERTIDLNVRDEDTNQVYDHSSDRLVSFKNLETEIEAAEAGLDIENNNLETEIDPAELFNNEADGEVTEVDDPLVKLADEMVNEAITSAVDIIQEQIYSGQYPSTNFDNVREDFNPDNNDESSDSDASSTTTEGSYRIVNSEDTSPVLSPEREIIDTGAPDAQSVASLGFENTIAEIGETLETEIAKEQVLEPNFSEIQAVAEEVETKFEQSSIENQVITELESNNLETGFRALDFIQPSDEETSQESKVIPVAPLDIEPVVQSAVVPDEITSLSVEVTSPDDITSPIDEFSTEENSSSLEGGPEMRVDGKIPRDGSYKSFTEFTDFGEPFDNNVTKTETLPDLIPSSDGNKEPEQTDGNKQTCDENKGESKDLEDSNVETQGKRVIKLGRQDTIVPDIVISTEDAPNEESNIGYEKDYAIGLKDGSSSDEISESTDSSISKLDDSSDIETSDSIDHSGSFDNLDTSAKESELGDTVGRTKKLSKLKGDTGRSLSENENDEIAEQRDEVDHKLVEIKPVVRPKSKREIFVTSAGQMSVSIDPPTDSDPGERTSTSGADDQESQQGEINKPVDDDEDIPGDQYQPNVTREKHDSNKTSPADLGKQSANTDERVKIAAGDKVKMMEDTQEWHEDPIPGMGAAQEESDSDDDSDTDSEYNKPSRPDSLLNGARRKKKISAGNILTPDSADDLIPGIDDIPTPDDLDTPDDMEGEGLEWEDDTPLTPGSSDNRRFVDYMDRDDEQEKYENTEFRKVEIAGKDYRVDMKVIEPYKKVLSHGGYYGDGLNAIILFCGCYLPDRDRHDYTYVMDNLFLYVISTLELLVAEDYMIVYFHGATPRRQMPSFGWLKRCYQMIDRRLRKNLKGLLMVHPTLWLKTVVLMTKPFVSSKFSSKLRFVKTIQELSQIVPMEYIYIPEPVSHTERMLQADPLYLEKWEKEHDCEEGDGSGTRTTDGQTADARPGDNNIPETNKPQNTATEKKVIQPAKKKWTFFGLRKNKP